MNWISPGVCTLILRVILKLHTGNGMLYDYLITHDTYNSHLSSTVLYKLITVFDNVKYLLRRQHQELP